MSVRDGCDRCGDRAGHGPVADAQCALWYAVRAEAVRLVVEAERPPSPGEVADLLAHLKTVYGEGSQALRAFVAVLDLGWRPVVGRS